MNYSFYNSKGLTVVQEVHTHSCSNSSSSSSSKDLVESEPFKFAEVLALVNHEFETFIKTQSAILKGTENRFKQRIQELEASVETSAAEKAKLLEDYHILQDDYDDLHTDHTECTEMIMIVNERYNKLRQESDKKIRELEAKLAEASRVKKYSWFGW